MFTVREADFKPSSPEVTSGPLTMSLTLQRLLLQQSDVWRQRRAVTTSPVEQAATSAETWETWKPEFSFLLRTS